MKHFKSVLCVTAVIAMLLTACGSFTYSLTSSSDHMSLEVTDADDGSSMESDYISVGKNRVAKVESALEKGKMQIDFVEATVFLHDDNTADVITGGVIATVTVGPDEDAQVDLGKGDYVVRFTAVGAANGNLTIDIEKKE